MMKEKWGVNLCLAFLVPAFAFGLWACGGGGEKEEQTKSLRILRTYINPDYDMNDAVKNPVHDFLTRATGYEVTYEYLPADAPMDKLNAIMAAGADEYDIIRLDGGKGDRYAEYAIHGALMDMGAVIEDYPNLKAISPELLKILTINDTFYAIPTASPSGRDDSSNADNFLLWRTDILKTMGREMPVTLDEFTGLLQAYKDQDPMKNGAANVPLLIGIGDLNSLRTSSIGGAFGVELYWNDEGGTLVPYQTKAGFFEFLLYLNDLYRRGLIDPEMPTNNASAIRTKWTTNRALVRPDGWWDIPSLVTTFKQVYPEATMEFGQPLEKNGQTGAGVNSKNMIDAYTFIPLKAKKWKAAMDFLNKTMDREIFKEMSIGKEGVEYTVNAEGGYDPVFPAFFDNRGNANWYLNGSRPEYSRYWLCRAKKDQDQYKAWMRINSGYDRFIKVNPASDVPVSIFILITSATNLSNSLTRDFMVNSIVSGVTRAQFDAFVADWRAQCGNDLITAYNDWYKNR
jgi:putative aldouronate transport system substrate-binding protein